MRQAVSIETEDTRLQLERPASQPKSVESASNFPSTVLINGEVYPYPKKIVSKYETIIDESVATQPANDDYAVRYLHERHNTTIDKFPENTLGEYERYTEAIDNKPTK